MLFPLNARQRKDVANKRPALCPPTSGDLDADQLDVWCAKVEAARNLCPDLSDATHLYNLGLGPQDPRTAKILDALKER